MSTSVTSERSTPRFLLLQIRNRHDPMRSQEIACFARALECEPSRIETFDLLQGVPDLGTLERATIILIGGSGDYSVAEGGLWLPPALDTMRWLVATSKPTFASCWGFQAMARALGGEVVTDLSRAEIGALTVSLTDAGRRDPIFGKMPPRFIAQMGHQDIVDRLPDGALRLASTDRVQNQAFCFPGKPIYCTQFHPELNRAELLQRAANYPHYIQRIAGVSFEEFTATCCESPEADSLLRRFVRHVLGPAE